MSLVELGPRHFVDPTKDQSLAGAQIYVGDPDTDPTVEGNQKTVSSLQEDGSEVELSQPILTGAGGIPINDGEYVTLTVDGDYSIAILDANDVQLYYVPSSYQLDAIATAFGRSVVGAADAAALWVILDCVAPSSGATLAEVDGSPSTDEYAQWTANGITGISLAQLKTNLGITVFSPTGCIMMWPLDTPPTGWLECDGSAISRNDYSDLWGVLSTDYGAGDGSTTFNLPDLRGQFIRGFDNSAGTDPDAATRTDRGDGTVGDNPGTKQADQLEAHDHDFTVFSSTGGIGPNAQGNVTQGTKTTEEAGAGTETRPTNVSLMFIIKT
jgi:microcystin-dependent protein